MTERSLWPFLNIPEKNFASLTVDKVIFTAVAGGFIAEGVNKLKPHSLDFISPLIEDHIGNFPRSFLAGYVIMNASHALLYKAFKEETAQKLEPIIPIASLMMVVGLNIITESLKNPNPEFVGDVLAGTIGGALAIAHMMLPDRLESDIVRKLKLSVNKHS